MAGKILIADDEEVIREALRLCLEQDDYELFEAADGIEAWNMARAVKPDLIILDVMMPGMVGYRVSKKIKSDPETENISVIFLSARGGKEVEATARKNGGDDFIVKPFDPIQLREKVKKALGK